MSRNNPYKPEKIKLTLHKKIIWLISMIGCGIYAIIVIFILLSNQIPVSVKLITIISYMIIGPLTIYILWILFYIWKTKNYPPSEKLVNGRKQYLLMLFLIGICVLNFAAYWNSGIMDLWLLAANGVYYFTKDEILAVVFYNVGAIGITPAFVEEFLKSLPSILAFFIVLQRKRNSEQKGKGMLGNELNGFLFGLIIGITFEILELISYLGFTILYGGNAFDIYLQVTIRNWAPIHILGGSIGGFAAGRAERLRFERGEENHPMGSQFIKFLKRFIPLWLIPVSIHFLWNTSSVWILLYVYTINAQGTDLDLILQIIVYVVLSSLSFALLLGFLRRANKIAKRTYRCPETGIIVVNEDVICTSFNDSYHSEYTQFSQKKPAKFCTNCGHPVTINARFCMNCGFNIGHFNSPPITLSPIPTKLYDGLTITLFIISIAAAIVFLIIELLLFVLNLLMSGPEILFLLIFQTSIAFLTIGLIIYAVIRLLMLIREYDGRKSILYWLILIFNLIGMFGICLIYGIVGLLYAPIYLSILTIGLIILFLFGAVTLLIFMIFVILKGQQTFQYQKIV
ncbi:MAG: zinc-ribbon domain-containing protein [Promethearchaeota archaeon]|nr:MAG: zinc-ribbon domain-containing protein [Candidatus Lokiarchaeota archaeon]